MTLQQQLDTLYQNESRKVQATLIRLLGDFELAEEAMQEAFFAALHQWPEEGLPDNPTAWLIRTGQRRGIDQIRKRQTARKYQYLADTEEAFDPEQDNDAISDDMLRLIFTCCHPSLTQQAQLALTLREMCGLTTEQVASALLQKPTTVAQRIVRAKSKIRASGIPYEVPERKELPKRLGSVLKVVYLMFNEGYSGSDGEQVFKIDLAEEAIRLAGQLADLLPEAEVCGLLALMLFHDARKAARQDDHGDLITLEDQDRSLWDADQIAIGRQWLNRAAAASPAGPYTLQAAIAAAHAESGDADLTDWQQIVALYEALYQQIPSPVIALNRAVAIAMRDGPATGLALLDQLESQKAIQAYYLYHAARADLHRRLGNHKEAISAYQRALALTQQGPEQRFLNRRLSQLIRPE
ncbi:MAG: RNA polymerase sigma factor [Saccharospirillum sp.]|uniref:RNA polymerase sigma factor n=1 Tax=Saccharospirillum sp. TaxID=2033801 RepID=UPI003297CB7D